MDKNVIRSLSYGMYVVGAKDDKLVGCVVNTVVQITSDPITIAVSINHDNYTNEIIKKTNKFSISILGEEVNPEIIGNFGYKSSRDTDKYENVDYSIVEELPIINNTCGNMICKVINTIETSTHTIFLANVENMFNYNNKTPMTYKYYHEVLKGKSPKNAPTFIEEKLSNNKTIWKCSVCGYEVESDELPEDFTCPICGEPVSVFKKVN